MIRAAFLLLVMAATSALAQATQKPTTPPASSGKNPASATQAPAGKTTLSGIYTRDEAEAGKELFASVCASCHPIVQHATPQFRQKWVGKPLSELFIYMRTAMPKNSPASLADEDYAVLLAYLLQVNRMPHGRTALSTDTLELRKIRIDTARTVGKN